MRRLFPWWVVALLFVIVPLIEIYLIIQLGQAVGPWWTILILLADGILGSLLVKHEGGRAWRSLQSALASGRMPATELADGALILVGGTLLLTPGFLSDVVGFFCILPFTRPLARRVLARVIARRLVVVNLPGPGQFGAGPYGAGQFGAGPSGAGQSGPGTQQRPGHGGVVQGEVVDEN